MPKDFKEEPSSVTALVLLRPGTSLKEAPVTKCLMPVYQRVVVARMLQAGLVMVTLQWLMGLPPVKCVFIGVETVVDGLGTFASVTAETSTSTSCHQQSIVLCGTAETGSEVENKS